MTHEEVDVLHKDLTAATDEIAEAVAAGATPAEAVKDAVAKRRQPTSAEVVPDPKVSEPPPEPSPPPPPPTVPPVPLIQGVPSGRTCPTCNGSGVVPLIRPGGTNARERRDAEKIDPKDCRHPTPINNYCARCDTTLKRGR